MKNRGKVGEIDQDHSKIDSYSLAVNSRACSSSSTKKQRERKNNTTSKFIKEVSKGVSFDGFTYQISRQSWLIVHTCGRNVRKEGEIEIRSTDFRPFSFFPPLLSFFAIKKTPTFANFDRYLLSSFRYDF